MLKNPILFYLTLIFNLFYPTHTLLTQVNRYFTISLLFTRLFADSSLTSRLNATYLTRNVFKVACLNFVVFFKNQSKDHYRFFHQSFARASQTWSHVDQSAWTRLFRCFEFLRCRREIYFIHSYTSYFMYQRRRSKVFARQNEQ